MFDGDRLYSIQEFGHKFSGVV